ncbi:MAG: hypothetical protein JW937_07950 [Candidatus Omnitrophica bacterium]|nr:hypothetical protein [Candidatus Omnitrophota bacterium]
MRFLRWLLALFLLPTCGLAVFVLALEISSIRQFPPNAIAFFSGMLLYFLLHFVLPKANTIYVLGHEFTHAVMTWFFGGSVRNFRISSQGGSVETSLSNLWVNLGPYLLPIYLMAAGLVYWAAVVCFEVEWLRWPLLGLMGAGAAFHLLMTLNVLAVEQQDLKDTGYFIGMVLILLVNLTWVAWVLGWIFGLPIAQGFIQGAWGRTVQFWTWIGESLGEGW